MGNEQLKKLMNGFNTLNKYVRLLSIRRGPYRDEARSFKEKMNARYASFKRAVIEDARLEKIDACFTCVESKIMKVIDKVESHL
jgi:hypothetical protein